MPIQYRHDWDTKKLNNGDLPRGWQHELRRIGNCFSPGYGVDHDEIMKAMIEEREKGGKSCWSSTNDEYDGSTRKNHRYADNVYGGMSVTHWQ